MGVLDARDILIGPGTLWRAPLTTAAPDETTVGYGESWGGAWVNMGSFLEGQPVVISVNETFVDVYVEQSTLAQNSARTRRETIIKTTLAEHSAANLAVVLQATATPTVAGAGQKAYSSIPFGSQFDVTSYKWGIEGLRVDSLGSNQPIRYFFHKGRIRLAGDINLAKQNPTGIPIEIMVLGDSTQSAGQEIGEIQIVTGAATTT